jgi:hypothetical protein
MADDFGYAGGAPTQVDEPAPAEELEGRRAPAYDGPPREGRYRAPWWVRAIGIVLLVCLPLVLLCGVATGVVALLAYTSPAASATSTQSFAVVGTPTVVIQAEAGDVNVIAGSASQVTVRLTRTARALNSGLAQQALNDMRITVTQAGDTITIEEHAGAFELKPLVVLRSFHLDLTVPTATNLTATLSAGNLTADHLQGTVSIETNAGNVLVSHAQIRDASIHSNAGTLRLEDVALSGNVTLGSNAGDIQLEGTLAPNTTLDAHLNAGSIALALPAATSAHLDAATNAGDINIEGWPISVDHNAAQASAGGDLTPNPSGTITIRVDAGSVTVTAR